MNRGFSLIEAVIYIGLIGLILTGTVTATYELLQGSFTTSEKTVTQNEGNFVLRKLAWALSSATGVSVPSPHELAVTRSDGLTAQFKLSGTEAQLKEGSGSYTTLTTENVSVDDLVFEKIPVAGGAPEGVTATVTIDGLDFIITKYLRQ